MAPKITISRPAAVVAVYLALGGLLTACSTGNAGTGGTVTVTVPPSAPASPSTESGSSSPTSSSSPSSSASATASTASLGGSCLSQLPAYLVAQKTGGVPVSGTTAFVVGQADKAIGRLSYLNCRYGVTGSGTAQRSRLEIGVSLYSTPTQAQARIGATIDDYANHGAQQTQFPANSTVGTLLTGGSGSGYTEPLAVVSQGQRTVAVTLGEGFATGTAAVKAATQLAELALERTGG